MPNVVRNPYSNTAGNAPPSLGNGVIAVNQSDGRLFYRNAAGAVTTFSSIASYATSASFPATGASSSVLYLASDTSRLHQWTGSVYVEIGVSGGGGSSNFTLPNATTSTLGGVVVGAGLSVDSGTVSANVVSVAGRTGTVTISSGDVSGLGSLATQSSVDYSSLTGTPSSFSPSSHASSHATGGSDVITPASIGAAATSHVHAASDISSGTLADARLPATVTRNENLRWAMQANANSIDWLPRGHGTIGNAGVSSGTLTLAFFTAPYSMTATMLTFVTGGTATASLSLCRFALFTVEETITDSVTATTPVITMVARTASDTTIGNFANTLYSRAFSTAGGYPSSYALVAGTRYAAGLIVVGTTTGTWQAGTVTTGSIMRLPPMAAGNVISLSDMPTAATSVSNGNFMLYGRIS